MLEKSSLSLFMCNIDKVLATETSVRIGIIMIMLFWWSAKIYPIVVFEITSRGAGRVR